MSLEVGTVNNYAGAKVLTDADPGKLGYTHPTYEVLTLSPFYR